MGEVIEFRFEETKEVFSVTLEQWNSLPNFIKESNLMMFVPAKCPLLCVSDSQIKSRHPSEHFHLLHRWITQNLQISKDTFSLPEVSWLWKEIKRWSIDVPRDAF